MALEYFLIHEDSAAAIRSREDRVHSIKLVMATANPATIPQLFSAYMASEQAMAPTEDEILSDSGGAWKFSATASPPPEEVEAILARMGTSGSEKIVTSGEWV